MMLRSYKFITLAAVSLLTACSAMTGSNVIQNRDTDYLKARSIPPITVPINFGANKIDAHYPVPDKNYPDSARKIDLTPPELSRPVAQVKPQPAAPTYRVATIDTTTPAVTAQQQNFQNFYFDSHTRSSTNGAGKPMGSVLSSILPTKSSSPAPAPAKPAQPKTLAQTNPAHVESKPAESSPTESSTVQPKAQPGVYYDRFTHR